MIGYNRNFFLSVLLFVLVLAGCENRNEGFKVGYIYPATRMARFVNDGNEIVKRLGELGVETVVEQADDDNAIQIAKGLKMIEEGVDLLIVVPVNGHSVSPLIRACHDAGVKVIAYNRLISNVAYDMFITGDNNYIAEFICSEPLRLHPKGNYVVLGGDRFDMNGYEIKTAVDSILKPHVDKGNVNVLYSSYIERWSKDNAMFELSEVMEAYNKDVDAVIASSVNLAKGALAVLEKYDLLGKVVVTGQDADLASVKHIYNGHMHATLYHPHDVLGGKVADIAVELLNGKDPQEIKMADTFNGIGNIPTFKIKSQGITKANLKEAVFDKGIFTKADVAGL